VRQTRLPPRDGHDFPLCTIPRARRALVGSRGSFGEPPESCARVPGVLVNYRACCELGPGCFIRTTGSSWRSDLTRCRVWVTMQPPSAAIEATRQITDSGEERSGRPGSWSLVRDAIDLSALLNFSRFAPEEEST
jgi:hypothetical protein